MTTHDGLSRAGLSGRTGSKSVRSTLPLPPPDINIYLFCIYTYFVSIYIRVTPQPPYEPERTPSDGEHIPSQFSMCYTYNTISVDHFYLH
jgi:hypothetical protein